MPVVDIELMTVPHGDVMRIQWRYRDTWFPNKIVGVSWYDTNRVVVVVVYVDDIHVDVVLHELYLVDNICHDCVCLTFKQRQNEGLKYP